jgi:CheY-like chemotaxis protein
LVSKNSYTGTAEYWLVIDKQGTIIHASPRFYSFVQVAPDAVTHLPFSSLIAEYEQDKFQREVISPVWNHSFLCKLSLNLTNQQQQNKSVLFECTFYPVPDNHQQLNVFLQPGLTGTMSDKMQASLIHVLRTGLQNIEGVTSLLQKSDYPALSDEYLNILMHSSRLLQETTDHITALHYLEEDAFTEETFSIIRVIQSARDSLSFSHQVPADSVKIRYDASVPEKMFGQKEPLTDQVTRLLEVLIHFSRNKSLQIDLNTESFGDESVLLRIDIHLDHPHPFVKILETGEHPANHLNDSQDHALFFVRHSIIRQLVSILKAKTATLLTDQRFTMQLYLSFPLISGEARLEELPDLAGISLLLVDDNEFNRSFAVHFLKKWKMVVFEAENGQEAVEKAEKYHPRVILMDLQMPVMDGFEASRKIRALKSYPHEHPARIIALSASGREELGNDYDESLFDASLVKPFQPHQLKSLITGIQPAAGPVHDQPWQKKPSIKDQLNFEQVGILYQNSPEEFKKILTLFRTSLYDFSDQFNRYLMGSDVSSLRAAIHKISSTSRLFEASQLLEIAAEGKKALTEELNEQERRKLCTAIQQLSNYYASQIDEKINDL